MMWSPPRSYYVFTWGGKPKWEKDKGSKGRQLRNHLSTPLARAGLRRLSISGVKNRSMSLGSGISCLSVGLEPLGVAIGPWLVTAAKQAFTTTHSSCTK